ncbi:RIP metalloprotease RseP [Paucibacter sp. R3-3]|uniref:Zinc metalloprotease n=1 Tax=Roseateles agri TaxID=3098619 RepID=A0ABU5DLB1_9BURK|nr:RIP metalloprotease RseP [Paucibacter sp. R3-3]MDY0747101.1 RIP metalloprotease RseP [Paucibacter sp. R3-3]
MTDLLAFLVTLAVLIPIHEYGHYRVAKACGVRVLRFSFGFGRVLWRRQASPDSTEFTISAIPLGGYVRLLGHGDSATLPPQLRAEAFDNHPLRHRVATIAAGPLANLLLAIVLFGCASWIGMDEPVAQLGTPAAGSVAERAGLRSGDKVLASSDDGMDWQAVQSMPELIGEAVEAIADGRKLYLQVDGSAVGNGHRIVVLDTDKLPSREIDASTSRQLGLSLYGEPIITRIIVGGAGDRAGLHADDRVLAVDGVSIADGAQLRERIRVAVDGAQGRAMHWRIERMGQTQDIDVQPGVVDEAGTKIGRLEILIGGTPQMVHVSRGLVDGLVRGAQRTWDTSWMTLKMFGRMIVGEASLKNLSGPLSIADYAGQSARLGIASFLSFLAFVSVSLGVFNLLPLPMLDGGHLMYYLFEGLTGRPLSDWWQQQLQRAGALILVLMMVLALSNDVVARLPGLH